MEHIKLFRSGQPENSLVIEIAYQIVAWKQNKILYIEVFFTTAVFKF